MALQYELKAKHIRGTGFHGTGPRSISNTQMITFDIRMYDDARELLPQDITEHQVLEIAEAALPRVNEDVFWIVHPDYNEGDVMICPWLYCTSKRCERDQGNRLLFRIICEFGTGNRSKIDEDQLKLIKAPISDFSNMPYLREKTWGGDDRVIYEEAKSGGHVPLRLPNGNLYSEPFTRRHPVEMVRQSQFEQLTQGNIDQTIRGRLFYVNSDAWNGAPTPAQPGIPPRWMINSIDYQKIRVRNRANSGFLSGYIMAYGLEWNERDGGWWDRRMLIDNMYLEIAGDLNSKVPAFDPTNGINVINVLLEQNGTLKGLQDAAIPEYKNYEVQPATSFGAFLKG